MPQQSQPKQSGFTLIELMITFAIIAILAAIAVPNYRNYTTQAKLVEAVQGLGAMRTDLQTQLQVHGEMPTTINGIPYHTTAVTGSVAGKETSVIEGYRYDGRIDYYWIAVRLKQGILPEDNLPEKKREIHLGVIENSAGEWVSFCGSWNQDYISVEYLPSGCTEPNVSAAMWAATQ